MSARLSHRSVAADPHTLLNKQNVCPPMASRDGGLFPPNPISRRSSSHQPRSRAQPAFLSKVSFLVALGARGARWGGIFPFSRLPALATGGKTHAQSPVHVVSSVPQMKWILSSFETRPSTIDEGERSRFRVLGFLGSCHTLHLADRTQVVRGRL